MKIRCVVERITYQNPENGYTILKCRVKDYEDLVPVIGNLLDVNVGSVLLVEGSWKVDAKYGRQFVAESWEETLPATVYGMEKYLGSGLIKGVGPKFAKRIVQKYGVNTFAIIEDSVEQLIEVDGIGHKRVQMIAESWERQKEVKEELIKENNITKLDEHDETVEAIYLPPFYYAEIGVAGNLKKLATTPAADRLWTGRGRTPLASQSVLRSLCLS